MLKQSVPSYFKQRRDELMKAHPDAAFILPATPEAVRNPDVSHPFRQESNFYYLSGFEEPESCLVLVPGGSAPGSYKTVLFVRDRDPLKEIWEGERYGTEGAVKVFGADEAYLNTQIEDKLPQLLDGSERVFYRVGMNEPMDRLMFRVLEKWVRTLGRSGRGLPALYDPKEPLGEMRLFKRPEEVELLRKAGSISAAAHKRVMSEIRPGMNEAEVEALIDYEFRRGGCQRNGYDSIVAGGKNACCLHYTSNNEPLPEGGLFLIDAGGEYDYYTADITRTYPVSGAFTDEQARIYDVALKAQKEAIALARPGTRYMDVHKRATEVLVDGLMGLGLLKGDRSRIIQEGAYRRFYPHSTGHWLGMDVHDVGLYTAGHSKDSRVLEPGMCFTIEPGIYCQPNDEEVPEKFRGIGVRIEDNILITEDGHENLTEGAPKERDEIVRVRRGG